MKNRDGIKQAATANDPARIERIFLYSGLLVLVVCAVIDAAGRAEYIDMLGVLVAFVFSTVNIHVWKQFVSLFLSQNQARAATDESSGAGETKPEPLALDRKQRKRGIRKAIGIICLKILVLVLLIYLLLQVGRKTALAFLMSFSAIY